MFVIDPWLKEKIVQSSLEKEVTETPETTNNKQKQPIVARHIILEV